MSAASELTCELLLALTAPDAGSRPELPERLRVVAEAHAALRRLDADERRSRRARVERRVAKQPRAMRAAP